MMKNNPTHYFNLLMLYVASMFIAVFAVLLLGPLGLNDTVLGIISQVSAQIICIYIFFKMDILSMKSSIKKFIDGGRKSISRCLLLYIGAAVFTILLTPMVENVITLISEMFGSSTTIPDSSENQSTIVGILNSGNIFTLVIMLILVTITAPIFEELIFRKALIGLFSHHLKAKWLGYTLSVVLFALIHVAFSGDFISIGPYLVSGTAFTLIYWYSDENIIYPIIVHMIWNIVVSVIVLNT